MTGTEHAGARFRELDRWSTPEVLEALWAGQSRAVAACLPVLPALSRAVELAAGRIGTEGRLVYVGAGSSAVLAGLDGLELPPTFGLDPERVVTVLAGIVDFVRGFDGSVEDDGAAGRGRMREVACTPADIVLGVSASGTSAFTVAAVETARAAGALTVGIVGNAGSPLAAAAELPLLVDTGEEVLAGSTRLAAGTAQKCLLNLFSTALMVRLGAVYGNRMVNVSIENAKLQRRAVAMLCEIANCDADAAGRALAASGGRLKQAALLLLGLEQGAAERLLDANGGNLRLALAATLDRSP
jgi:N-acetylmuramic acid 6-phosphate etherase